MPSLTFNQQHLTMDATAKLREQFTAAMAKNHPIRGLFFADGKASRDTFQAIQLGALGVPGKMSNFGQNNFLSINTYSRKVELQPFGAAIQIDELDFERLGYMPELQRAFVETAGTMGTMLSNLWERFLYDALTGGTTFLPSAVKSPDGTVSSVFSTAGHYGGNIVNSYDGGTSFSNTTIRADHKEIKNLATTAKDDQGELIAGLGTPSFTYLVPSDRAEEYAQALEAPLVGLAPYSTGPGSLTPVAAVSNMLPLKNNIRVIEWGRLNALSPETVFVVVDYGQGADHVVSGAPFELLTWKAPRLQYASPDARNFNHLWVSDAIFGVRLARPASVYNIDKAA